MDLRQLTPGRRKLVVSSLELLHVFFEFLVGNVVKLHVPGVHVVVGIPTAKAEKKSCQKSCRLLARGRKKIACQGEPGEEENEKIVKYQEKCHICKECYALHIWKRPSQGTSMTFSDKVPIRVLQRRLGWSLGRHSIESSQK